MKLSTKSILRMTRIAAHLKQNDYPNKESLCKEFREYDLNDINPNESRHFCMASASRTVQRDISTLRNHFKCPVAYSMAYRGYYLTKEWEFVAPAVLDENEMLAAVLGAKIAVDLFPNPIRANIVTAVDELVKGSYADFLDTTCMKSMFIFANVSPVDRSDVFATVFRAWQLHRVLRIKYDDMKGNVSERCIEPHAMVFYDRQWNIKAICRLKNGERSFVISRISEAEMLPEVFKPSMKLINAITADSFLHFAKVQNVVIRITREARKYALANRMHSKQSIRKEDGKDTYLLTIPAVAGEVVVPWIMSQQGKAIPLEPPCIVDAVRTAADTVLAGLAAIPQ